MKTHDNRALFSKALLKAATCFFLIAGAGMSPVFALQGTAESMKMEITQQTVTVSGVVKDRKGNPSLVPISWKKERPTVPLPILTGNTG